MNVLRGIGRLLLGSFFIVNGVKAIREPAPLVPSAEPLAERLVPFAQRTLPPSVAAYVPEDTTTLVRANGALGVVGGLGMATGIGRRGAAGLAALSMVPHVLAANPRGAAPSEQGIRRSLFLRNLALLGAALVVSQDTAGQPSLAWRATAPRARLAREAGRAKATVAREAGHTKALLARDARRLKREAQLQARVARKTLEGALS